ncbi:MAG: FecR domain-containing protein [Gammaproteobacteria bacterium]|nr:FecR domain-containing protein [Gammaproteobacteria bacterium]
MMRNTTQSDRHPVGRNRFVMAVAAVALSIVAAGTVQAAPVGEVITMAGRVFAANNDGQVRALAKGAQVENGETIVTSMNSLVRIKFIDDAYVILRPNTRFQITDYNMDEDPAQNRSVFRLLKGGLRTVTGLIGRRNRSGYQLRTAISTIGIRGTDYEAMTCSNGDCGPGVEDGDYVGVKQGEIDVNSPGGGSTTYGQGEFGFFAGGDGPPIKIPASQAGALSNDPLPDAVCE